MGRPFRHVDAFTTSPYRGNPVAVVLHAEGLTDEEMQRFAHWTNLSETMFVLPPTEPEADYRVQVDGARPEREYGASGSRDRTHAARPRRSKCAPSCRITARRSRTP
jgi:PhzF family phenazine biosynthesis protein